MGKDIAGVYPEAREVFEEADDSLQFRLSRLCFEGPESELQLTENTQPAILTTSVAFWRVLQRAGHRPQFVAGHSLGEYSALVCAGALRFSDAVKLVRLRGRFMQEAVPLGVGAMAAIIGLDLAAVTQVCQEGAQGEVVAPANVNAPSQIVVAGHAAAVHRATILARQRGARNAIPLMVSAPFHCELMRPAQVRLEFELDCTTFQDLNFPLVNNVDAQLISAAADARQGLARQVSSTVRWSESVEVLAGRGVETFVEVGPGKVLTGLIRRISPSKKTLNVGNREQLESYV